MGRAHMKLINDEDERHKLPSPSEIHRMDIALEELIRRAKLQAGELSLLIQRLEHLRRDIGQHLRNGEDPVATGRLRS